MSFIMIISMTGFSSETVTARDFSITCKIKSVNHRYSDFEIFLPITDYELESQILNLAKQKILRGKVTIYFDLEKGSVIRGFSLDLNLLGEVKNSIETARGYLGDSFDQVKDLNILNFSGIVKPEYLKDDFFKDELINVFNKSLSRLIEQRCLEGLALEKDLNERLGIIKSGFSIIKENKG
ncbi:MAG TPA: hypothetical protein ENN73_02455, partial [Firmicutes bacterium]|nr:hypothetical protein [Bacillota bacterium]